MKYRLGISALHDLSSACLMDDDSNIIAIIEEYKRIKKPTKNWPTSSINRCIQIGKVDDPSISKDNIKQIFYERPLLTFIRQILISPRNLKKYWHLYRSIRSNSSTSSIRSHVLGTIATSPFKCGIYVMANNIGEFKSFSIGTFNGDILNESFSQNYKNSLGILYNGFMKHFGYDPITDIDKFSQLGLNQRPSKIDFFKEVILEDTLNYELKINPIYGISDYLPNEIPVSEIGEWVASLQFICTNIILRQIYSIHTNMIGLVLCGSLFRDRIISSQIQNYAFIKEFWMLPDPGDISASIGAAWAKTFMNPITGDHFFYGNDIDGGSNPTKELLVAVTSRLEHGEIIGWIQGKEELGNHSLGHRSILFDPTNHDAIERYNKMNNSNTIKLSILDNKAISYFKIEGSPSNYRSGNLYCQLRNQQLYNIGRSTILHTVPSNNDSFSRLLVQWGLTSNNNVIVNEDFKYDGILISERKDAINYLLTHDLDCLIIGNKLYYKKEKHIDGHDFVIESIDYSNGIDSTIIR